MNALWTYLNSTSASEAHRAILTDALSHPGWDQMYIPSYIPAYVVHEIVPLPPLLRLTRYRRPDLQFDEVPLLSARLVRDFLRTVSQLDNLRTLQLGFPWPLTTVSVQVLRMLFFSCPESLVEFKVWGNHDEAQKGMNLELEECDWDFGQGSLALRQRPLYCLKTLEAPLKLRLYCPALLLCPILRHCPVHKTLQLPWVMSKEDMQAISRTIWDHCPGNPELSLSKFNSELLTISRQSGTLREIDFSNCQNLQSTTLRTILTSCRALQVLKAQDEFSEWTAISLRDAVTNEWACSKIRHLEIAVRLTLEVLNIKYQGVSMGPNGDLTENPFKTTSLPGLLALEDTETSQIRFLSRWSGLTKLQRLTDHFQ
ncbi:hypothetical protein BG015_012100 [Linnemannia schmuckeri]|uniref:Uncharacterized protein n=1 Tax=Linnemannia schmuckeri TaxID=64567 RepID=A0A9P5RV79_9FUNG|nr:hypothetical protein BG015_012100 [Linnemannia schmuckeri]